MTILPGPAGEPPNRIIEYVDARTGRVIETLVFYADPEQNDGKPYLPPGAPIVIARPSFPG